MQLDVSHAEYAGGGPGFVLVRVVGRARAARPCRLAPPTLLIADGGTWRRLAAAPGAGLLAAGPEAPPFAVDVEVPLHLAVADGPWWLEPGVPVADAHATATVDALRTRVRELGAELAALRERATAAEAAPTPAAVEVPRAATAHRMLRPTLPALLVAAGALAVGDAAATVLWQEPLSAVWAGRQQQQLEGEVARLDRTLADRAPAAATLPPSPEVRMRALARTLERTASAGNPIGRLRIPSIGAHYVVVQGTGSGSLRRGPGHYLGTALPGEAGTVGIAGHRTTYGAPFRHLDALRRGDPIDVTMPYGEFVYRVEGTRIVRPQDVSALRSVGRQRLVLTACHPLYSAAQRIVVLASLQRVTPRGAARVSAATPGTTTTPAAGAAAGPGPQA